MAAGLFLTLAVGADAQATRHEKSCLPTVALKTNALYWATLTTNLGVEVGLSPKLTLDLSGGGNPWKFSDNRQLKLWYVQPELRYWFCERFNGSFIAFEGHYGKANVSNIDIFGLGHDRYDGKGYGGGLTYGYQWMIGNRWNMEAEVGVGYARLDYDKYEHGKDGAKIGHNSKNYWGPTRAALSFIYFIN